jgi:hypothetical protein
MSTRVVDRVEDWDERSFTGGYHTLAEFEDSEFSGVIRAGGAELFMTKGIAVGIRNGSLDDFEDASGTAYVAPSPALPLLAIMQETSDEVRAEYYSEKTAIAEVDSTLSDGGFTGYVELADNVLSGDYYQVYHAGTSMSVGFIGQSARLVDGDEAFETANDEVGIYQVYPADIDVIEIPADSTPSPDDTTAGGDATAPADEGAPADDTETQKTSTEAGTSPAVSDDAASAQATETSSPTTVNHSGEPTTTETTQEAGATSDDQTEQEETAPATTTDTASVPDQHTPDSQGEETRTDQHDETGPGVPESEPRQDSRDPQTAEQRDTEPTRRESETEPRREPDPQQTQSQPPSDQEHARRDTTRQTAGTPEPDISEEEYSGGSPSRAGDGLDAGLETKAIPSLDPTRTVEQENTQRTPAPSQGRPSETQRSSDTSGQTVTDTGRATQDTPRTQATGDTADERAQQPSTTTATHQQADPDPPRATEPSGQASDPEPPVQSDRLEELEAELDERETEIDRLESELERKTTEHEDTKDQLNAVREERDQLQAEVDRLESELAEMETELERLETQFGAATDTERRMTPSEALAQTDLLPRYDSKGDATLKKAHSGSHRAADVVDNLNILTNPQFEEEAVSVGGQTYREFIDSTLEYRFVQWVIRDLLFEIRETGHEKALRNLYDAIPQINRIDLDGVVDVVYTQDGQETRSQESFDIVFRDRMGEPLVVANLNDSRQEASQEMMENLVRSAERVGQSVDEFASAFLVTRGVFEPAALDTAEEATKGGLFSRDKRKSFVNLSRKNGYHLCLVEAPEENFSLLVPEL